MLSLYFGDVFSILTLALVAGLAVFIVLAIKSHSRIQKWGQADPSFYTDRPCRQRAVGNP